MILLRGQLFAFRRTYRGGWWELPSQPSADLAVSSLLPILKSILSVVPAPKENPQSGKDLGRALPIEFVELSRTESYGY